mmetsp:Transcript_21077/g.58380  ORF Transcript_21077/g.58380 Transcript_21077/m.58380 type:complete len:355 (-) Transcript_21077:1576-2640(-)
MSLLFFFFFFVPLLLRLNPESFMSLALFFFLLAESFKSPSFFSSSPRAITIGGATAIASFRLLVGDLLAPRCDFLVGDLGGFKAVGDMLRVLRSDFLSLSSATVRRPRLVTDLDRFLEIDLDRLVGDLLRPVRLARREGDLLRPDVRPALLEGDLLRPEVRPARLLGDLLRLRDFFDSTTAPSFTPFFADSSSFLLLLFLLDFFFFSFLLLSFFFFSFLLDFLPSFLELVLFFFFFLSPLSSSPSPSNSTSFSPSSIMLISAGNDKMESSPGSSEYANSSKKDCLDCSKESELSVSSLSVLLESLSPFKPGGPPPTTNPAANLADALDATDLSSLTEGGKNSIEPSSSSLASSA